MVDFWIILKKGADPEYVKQVLYKSTSLQSTRRVNLEVIVNDEIKRISYKAYILNFLEYRRNVKFRLYNFRLQNVTTRLHEIEIYIKVLESGDVENIIHAIRNQKPSEEAELIAWLMKKLKITDLQAKFVLNTQIKRLSKSSLSKYKEEQKNLKALADQYIKVITTPSIIDAEIEQELIEVKQKYDRALQIAVDYALDANEDKHANEIYELHVYFAVSLGEVLEIDSKETMQTLKDMVIFRYTK